MTETTHELLSELAADSPTWSELADRLRKRTEATPDVDVSKLVDAFSYFLAEPQDERRNVYGPFRPLMEGEGWAYPQPLESIDQEVLAIWESHADCDGPVAASRLHDLLWERRYGDRPDLHARAAIEAYEALSDLAAWKTMYQTEAMRRALELSASIRDLESAGRLAGVALRQAKDLLARDEPQVGAISTLFAAVLRLPKASQPSDIDALLDASLEKYRQQPYVFSIMADYRATRLPQEERQDLRRQQVLCWVEEADRADGWSAEDHFLRQAVATARAYDLNAEADDLLRRLQDLRPGPDDLHAVTSEVSIPTAEVDKAFAFFLDESDWRITLAKLGANGPPSGDLRKNLASVEGAMKEHPLLFLITKTIHGSEGVLIKVVASEEDHRAAALSEQELMGIEFSGLFGADVLDRVTEQHGVPSMDDLERFFTTDYIAPGVAERMGAALRHYWGGEYDEAAHVLAPRVEQVLRGLARAAGLVVVRLPSGSSPGRVHAL